MSQLIPRFCAAAMAAAFVFVSIGAAQERLDLLDYYTRDNVNEVLQDPSGGSLGVWIDGNRIYMVKGANPEWFEFYSYDNDYIYMTFDRYNPNSVGCARSGDAGDAEDVDRTGPSPLLVHA